MANSAPLDNYPTADGTYVCIVAGSDTNFRRLCAAMGRPGLADEPEWATLAQRAARSDEINDLVATWTSGLTAAEVEAACIAHEVPVATAYTAADILADPHMAARGDLVDGGRPGGRAPPPAGPGAPARRARPDGPAARTPPRRAQRRGLAGPGRTVGGRARPLPGRRRDLTRGRPAAMPHIAVLAPMPLELDAVVAAFGLGPADDDGGPGRDGSGGRRSPPCARAWGRPGPGVGDGPGAGPGPRRAPHRWTT